MLMVACGAGHIPLARFLLENGADIHMENQDGATALIHAIRSESEPMVKYLLDIAQPDIHRRNSVSSSTFYDLSVLFIITLRGVSMEQILRFVPNNGQY